MAAKPETSDERIETCDSKDYAKELLQQLRELQGNGMLCDFTMTAEGKVIKVHKAILTGCSDYFRAMFSHGMADSKRESIDLKGMSAVAVKALVSYAYSGKMDLSLETIPDILAAAMFLQITSAIELCAAFLKRKMTFDNSEKILELGCNYGLQELKAHNSRMILDNFLAFAETDQFLALSADNLACYLEDDSLKTKTEAKLLKCALKWYDHDPHSRDATAHHVFDRIRYAQDGWPTIEFAYEHDPFRKNKKCKEIVKFAERYLRDAHKKHMFQSHRTRVRSDRRSLVQFGGVKRYDCQGYLGFEIPDDEPDENQAEKSGCGKNHYYHLDLEKWFPLGVIGDWDCRSHCPLVEVNDFGMLVGGYLYTSDFVRTYQHCSNEVKLFTSGCFSLWDLPYLNEPRAHHTAVHAKDFVYAIGGKNEMGPLTSVEQYNLEREEWKHICPLPNGVFDHASVGFQDKVYVSGGVVGDEVVNSVWCYNPADDAWNECAPMLTARAGHTMNLIGDQLIVCGGRNGGRSSRCLTSVESYSLELGQWTSLTPMRMDCQGMAGVVLDGKLLTVGGEDSVGDLLRKIQCYDPAERSWSFFGDLPMPLKNMGCIVVTMKMTDDGEEDRNSLEEAFEANFLDDDDDNVYYHDYDDEEHDYGAYYDEDGHQEYELQQLEYLRSRNQWPC